MKEATGELSMTVIVIIGAIAVMAIVSFLVPEIKDYVKDKWQGIDNTGADKCSAGQYWDVDERACKPF